MSIDAVYTEHRKKQFGEYRARAYDGYTGMEAATVDTKSAPRRIRELPRKEVSVTVLSSAELVECTCPDFCDRDHDRD
jgi:hypothetical protein